MNRFCVRLSFACPVSQRAPLLAAIALLSASPACPAADVDSSWQLTTADFKTITGALSEIGDGNITLDVDSKPIAVPIARTIQLGRPVSNDPVRGLVLCATGGQRLVGRPLKIDGTSLVWSTSGLGDVAIPISQSLGILRDSVDANELTLDRPEDTVLLSTGDTVHGIITGASNTTFTVAPATGDPAAVAVDTIAKLLFASPPGGRKPVAPAPFTVGVSGGSVIACRAIAFKNGSLHADLASGAGIDVPLAQIVSIENTGGPVQWLSSRRPIEAVYTPYAQGNYPPRMDKSVTGRPIRFGDRTYAKGIGVHSRTKLVYGIEPGDKTFRTRYAIDGALSQADVEVRIWLDGKVVHEKKGFRAGAISPVIEFDVAGAKRLELEVDYGAALDVQDRLNWIEPAVVRGPAKND